MIESIEYWQNERCESEYNEKLGLRCVQEKGHEGTHRFTVNWNDYTK